MLIDECDQQAEADARQVEGAFGKNKAGPQQENRRKRNENTKEQLGALQGERERKF